MRELADGTKVEVMLDVVRDDVRKDLPILSMIDDEQQALFARFVDVEWHYVKPAAGGAAGDEQRWWRTAAAIEASVACSPPHPSRS